MLVECNLCLANDGSEFKFTEATKVVYEEHDTVGAVVLKRHKGSVRIGSGGDHLNEVRDELIERGHWGDTAMAAFVVDTEPDLEFGGTQMSVGYCSARYLSIVNML